jgi:hypothetical protein
MSALIIGMGSIDLASIDVSSALASPRPDQRDPTVSDDSTQGNIVGRPWLNATTGRLWRAGDVPAGAAVWSDRGMASLDSGDTGTWGALLGTKPLTSAYASGIKPFVDVYAVDRSIIDQNGGGFMGPFTINFIDGVIDTATIRSLQAANPGTEAGTGWIVHARLIVSVDRFKTAHKPAPRRRG